MPQRFPLRLFISYSHKDESLRESLGDHLASLQREGLIEAWHDRKITAGQEWAGAIDTNLEEADIILCLVSAGFLASPYCSDVELRRALERHEAEEACLIPVILKPADWDATPLGRLQALPANAKPVTNWSNRDEAFLSIARGIREVVQRLAESPRPARVTPRQPPPPTGTIPGAPAGSALPDLESPEGPVHQDSVFYINPPD